MVDPLNPIMIDQGLLAHLEATYPQISREGWLEMAATSGFDLTVPKSEPSTG
jgi:hypothetical protein